MAAGAIDGNDQHVVDRGGCQVGELLATHSRPVALRLAGAYGSTPRVLQVTAEICWRLHLFIVEPEMPQEPDPGEQLLALDLDHS